MSDRLLPHNVEIEDALIGGLLVDQDEIIHIRDIVDARDFYQVKASKAYAAIVALFERGMQHADINTIAEAMAGDVNENVVWLLGVFQSAPLNRSTETHARIVSDKAVRRRMIAAASEIASAGFDEDKPITATLPEVEAKLLSIRSNQAHQSISKPQSYTSQYLDRFNELRSNGHHETGIKTGIKDLDRLIGSMEAPHQYILAARPKMGKSSLMLTIAHNAVMKRRKRVALFTLEMSSRQVIDRIVSIETRIPLNDKGDGPCIKKPWTLDDTQASKVYEAMGRVSESGLFIDDTAGITPGQIRVKCLRLFAEHGLDFVIVDHLHIMAPDRRLNRSDLEYGEMTMSLAALYKELEVPGLTVAQLSRGVEQRKNKRPMLSDLRDSGRIEENAYAIMFLYRAGYYDDTEDQGIAEVTLAADRDGETGRCDLFWNAKITQFADLMREVIQLPEVRAGGR